MSLNTVYAEITKSETQEDGTLLVSGRVSDSTVDTDQQIADPEWLKTAIPNWFKWGNIREMHGPKAAGVATEYSLNGEDGHDIVAHIVDKDSCTKVQAGVLKGFSVGIRDARVIKDNKAAGGRIVSGNIVEVSLVDRPANPSCTLTLAKSAKPGMDIRGDQLDQATMLVKVEELTEKPEPKTPEESAPTDAEKAAPSAEKADSSGSTPPAAPTAEDLAEDAAYLVKSWIAEGIAADVEEIQKRDFSAAARRAAASRGTAMPDGSFPIESEEDLHNAVRLAAQAKDPDSARRHIISRARAMGMLSAIPQSWHNTDDKAATPEEATFKAAMLMAEKMAQGETEKCDVGGQALGWLLSIDSIVDNGLKILSKNMGVPNPDVDAPGSVYQAARPDTPSLPLGGPSLTKVAEVQAAAMGEILERLDRLEKAPMPGGPSRVRPADAAITSRRSDEILVGIAEYEALAKTCNERDVSNIYLKKAADLREEYAKLRSNA